MSDYEPTQTEPMHLGALSPSVLTTQAPASSSLPWAPPAVSQAAPTTAQPAQPQPDGVNAPVPTRTYPHPEPTGGPRPVPFAPPAR